MIKTRFAPSPTGSLHIGGIRTALFNWAFARRHEGHFVLRIDDTDVERNQPGAIQQIMDDLHWIGIDFDDLIYQSQRTEIYSDAAKYLVNSGLAYYCDCLKGSNEPCQCRSKRLGDNAAIRLDIGKFSDRIIEINDLVLGSIKQNIRGINDPIIMRTGGLPVYSLATVVDDAALGITHVIRGQEHLTNTFLQVLLYESFGYVIPHFAHIPFICKPKSHKKLSKRDSELGLVTLQEYRKKGYLPEALFNYLTHLGWSLDDKTEKWDRQTFVNNFGFDRVVKTPAQFDPEKLIWLQREYMREIPNEEKVKNASKWLGNTTITSILLEALGDRLQIYSDLDKYRHFVDDKFFSIEIEALQKRVPKNAAVHLYKFQDQLKGIENWNESVLEEQLREYCSREKIPVALLIHALRVASTGQMIGFGVFLGLEILGKDKTIERISRCLSDSANLCFQQATIRSIMYG
jgi:glutamyl/glutaminyl-tRNA synthetase